MIERCPASRSALSDRPPESRCSIPCQYLRSGDTPMPPDEFASARATHEQQSVTDVEAGVVTETGEVLWTSVSAVPMDFPDWRTAIITANITSRKRTEQALQHSATRLQILAEASRAFAEAGGDDQALLDQVARVAAEQLHATCSIRLLSDDGQWLDLTAVGHYDPAQEAEMQETLVSTRIHIDEHTSASLAVPRGAAVHLPA
jgi:PAS domain-containing protein